MGILPHVALAAVCIPSVGFFLWFLVRLARDEKRERGRRLAFLHGALASSETVFGEATVRAGWAACQRGAAGFETSGCLFDRSATLARRPAQPQVSVLRLADKRAENAVKLRWLIMTLVLSAGVGATMKTMKSSRMPACAPFFADYRSARTSPPMTIATGPRNELSARD